MAIQVLLFASLREKAGTSALSVDGKGEGALTAETLIAHLPESVAKVLKGEGAKLRCAVNHQMVLLSHAVCDGDEVAFFPPVTGG